VSVSIGTILDALQSIYYDTFMHLSTAAVNDTMGRHLHTNTLTVVGLYVEVICQGVYTIDSTLSNDGRVKRSGP